MKVQDLHYNITFVVFSNVLKTIHPSTHTPSPSHSVVVHQEEGEGWKGEDVSTQFKPTEKVSL